MTVLRFTLSCTPTAQARVRHGRTKSGLHMTFKSANQKANERTLEALLAPYAPKTPLVGPLASNFLSKRRFLDTPPQRAAPAVEFDAKRFEEAAEKYKNRYKKGAA